MRTPPERQVPILELLPHRAHGIAVVVDAIVGYACSHVFDVRRSEDDGIAVELLGHVSTIPGHCLNCESPTVESQSMLDPIETIKPLEILL